jgi:hypothetical protein
MAAARPTEALGDAPADRAENLPPAKAALARAIAAVKRAREDLEAAQQPVDKLVYARAAATQTEAAELRGEIARLRAAHAAEIDRWVEAGSDGKRPMPAAELVPLERALGATAGAAREAEVRFPAAQRDYVRAAERARHAISAREQATWPAAAEAAEATFGELEQAIAAARSAEARLLSLVYALREAGAGADDDGNAALAAAAKMEQRVIAARRRSAPGIDPAPGRRLLERLRSDPAATF